MLYFFYLFLRGPCNLVTNALFPITLNWSIFTWDLLIFDQLKKHRRTDHELKKRVLKIEFCLWSCHPLVCVPPHLPLLLAPLLFSCCDWDKASWILNLGQNLGGSRTTMMPGTYSYFIWQLFLILILGGVSTSSDRYHANRILSFYTLGEGYNPNAC
jgi:hypothetical protein